MRDGRWGWVPRFYKLSFDSGERVEKGVLLGEAIQWNEWHPFIAGPVAVAIALAFSRARSIPLPCSVSSRLSSPAGFSFLLQRHGAARRAVARSATGVPLRGRIGDADAAAAAAAAAGHGRRRWRSQEEPRRD